ncbi:MAG: cation:proton antiporter [Candidatus Binatia bacterium]
MAMLVDRKWKERLWWCGLLALAVGGFLLVNLVLPAWAESGHEASGHGGQAIQILLALAIILFAAKLGGDLMVRLGQPEVLGELLIGIILGNLTLLGLHSFEFIRQDEILPILSEIGVVLLLFEVGLHTTIPDMMRVGTSAFLVAVLGVITPFLLGWGVSLMFAPEAESLVHAYLGATLTATSVGITARVLSDLKRLATSEAKIVLGAAVIDDVLGLMVLAVVGGIIAAAEAGTTLDVGAVAGVLARSVGFLVIAVGVGRQLMPMYFRLVTPLRSQGILLASSLILCFGLAYVAGVVGLAPIVGAFTAGLILEPTHYRELSAKNEDEVVEELIRPLVMLLVPVFFVIMGARVNLQDFVRGEILGFAVTLTLAAILGKQICGLGVLDRGTDRVAVGLGMIPRGEVGLIFASIGASLTLHGKPLIDSATYGAVVIMVVVTTLVTPPLIKWRFGRLQTPVR